MMVYPETDFDIDTTHLTVSHKPSGTVFRFDDHPDPVNGSAVRVSLPGDVCESELPEICSAAAVHLLAQLYRMQA